MSSLKEQKQELRDEVLTKRGKMPQKEWLSKSLRITEALTDSKFYDSSKVVHTYISMNQRKEVSTDELIEELFESDKKVVVPITNFSDHSLTHIELHSFGELITNKWGVREPGKKQDIVAVEALDLIVIPMAAADRKGNRLGYGKGFYDRFLEQSKALKAGLVFSDFVYDEIPVEDFDVKLDVIITEDELIFL
ncbi:5-formyltetrahydrofolate cyclo-ligase [Gracilimonas tropica]|uniref:5-formyltetrahydrofolate cyclo-ligase n=1 Tax=Gracilimonas tropica TaxID=454600 RepID=UPI000380E25D|nr:5-formyltetrahydrofolate cyclo-ligase [Gracilimonas tropica]